MSRERFSEGFAFASPDKGKDVRRMLKVWQQTKGVRRVGEQRPMVPCWRGALRLLGKKSVSTPQLRRGSAKREHRGESSRNQPSANTS